MAHHSRTLLSAALLMAGVVSTCVATASEPAPASAGHRTHLHPRHHHGLRSADPASPAPAHGPLQAASATTAPAPLPNESVAAPLPHTAPETAVAPSVFQLHYPPQGDGYVTGSSPQAMDDRNAAKATGVEVTVPLPQ